MNEKIVICSNCGESVERLSICMVCGFPLVKHQNHSYPNEELYKKGDELYGYY